MKKIFLIFIIALVIFTGCDIMGGADGSSGSGTEKGPWIIDNPPSKEENYEDWLWYNMYLVAYMFNYDGRWTDGFFREWSDPETSMIFVSNQFRGENERPGVCTDYSIYFALQTNSYVVLYSGKATGIYKVIGRVNIDWTYSGNTYPIPGTNQVYIQSWDYTEVFLLEKTAEFTSNLKLDPTVKNHAWNLSECGNYLIDVTVLDAGTTSPDFKKIN